MVEIPKYDVILLNSESYNNRLNRTLYLMVSLVDRTLFVYFPADIRTVYLVQWVVMPDIENEYSSLCI